MNFRVFLIGSALTVLYSQFTIVDVDGVVGKQHLNQFELCKELREKDLSTTQILLISDIDHKQVRQHHRSTLQRIMNRSQLYYVDDVKMNYIVDCIKGLQSYSVDIEKFIYLNDEMFEKRDEQNSLLVMLTENFNKKFLFQERIIAGVDDTVELAQKDKKDGKKTINLGPQGFFGIFLIVFLAIVLLMYFTMIEQTGDFNIKFVKEKMPLGKEYQFIFQQFKYDN